MPDRAAPPDVWVGRDGVPADLGPTVVTIGVFDGVHRGHRLVVARAAAVARADDVPCVAVTFDPHPADVVGRGGPVTLLSSVGSRCALLGDAGADAVWVLQFTPELSHLSAEEFVTRLLVERLHPRAVVVGADFRFGYRAAGDVGTLRDLGSAHGFTVEPVALAGRDGTYPWSSSTARDLLARGDVEGAAAVLGRAHRVEGTVVHGDNRGRALGYPTANLAVDQHIAVPADGVYAGWLVRANGERLPAAISVGSNPTFEGAEHRVEAYVLDRDDLDLYSEQVAVEFERRLRGMERFGSAAELTEQMAADVRAARAVLA